MKTSESGSVSVAKKTSGKSVAEKSGAKLPSNTLPAANRALIEQSLSMGMSRVLGIRLRRLSQKRIDAEMRVTPDHINRSGRVNGGVLMAFADIIGAMGTLANLPQDCRTTTLESKTNFFAAGEGDTLAATTVPLHIGRSTMVWQTTISNLDGTRVAIVTQTQIVIPKKT